MTLGKIAIIGSGMAASSLAPAMKKAGANIAFIYDRNAPKAQGLAKASGAKPVQNIEDTASADTFILAVPDDTIEAMAEKLHLPLEGKNVIHISGSRSLELLKYTKDKGANVASWHPAQTLGRLTDLKGVSFGITAEDGALKEALFKLTKDIGGHPIYIPEEQKPLYHAATCLASNYVCTMLYMAEQMLDKAGVSAEESRRILNPLLLQAQTNISQYGAQQALTGPIQRGDIHTIEKHIEVLKAYLPDTVQSYAAVGKTTVEMVQTFNPDILKVLEKALEESQEK